MGFYTSGSGADRGAVGFRDFGSGTDRGSARFRVLWQRPVSRYGRVPEMPEGEGTEVRPIFAPSINSVIHG